MSDSIIATVNDAVAKQQLLDPNGFPLGGLQASADKWDMFKARAQAFISGEFTTQIVDKWGANTDVATGGFGGAPASVLAQVTSGRCGGAQMNMSAATGTGSHFECGATQGTSSQAILVADQIWDPWYVEAGVKVISFTGNAEIAFCGLFSFGNPPSAGFGSDGTAIYMSLGIDVVGSASFLVVRAYNGTTLTRQVTTIPIETATYRRYFLAHDGLSTLYVGRDGVIFPLSGNGPGTGFPMFPQQPSTSGCVFEYERANGGSYSCNWDYYAAAGVAP